MKSTKNLLITGITLAIALFASVQVSAMDQKQTTKRIKELDMEINLNKAQLQIEQEYLQKTKRTNVRAPGDQMTDPQLQKQINERIQTIRALEIQLNNLKAYQNSPLYNY